MSLIKEFKEREHVSAELLVTNVTKGVNTNRSNYLSIDFRDATGVITGKKWDATDEDEKLFVVGNVLLVTGDVLSYKDVLQLKITEAVSLDASQIDMTKFSKAPPIPKAEIVKKFDNYVASIKDTNCKKLLEYFVKKFNKTLYDAPAATNIHHEYSSGLIYHMTTMADLAEVLAKTYPDVNRDLLITGTLIHDIGKLVELEGPVVYKYSLQGQLLGHISIMVGLIKEANKELNLDEEFITVISHMVLSHHGEYEFGSPILPQTKEAMMLYLLDNLDSKITIVDKALENVKKGEFSQKIFALDNRTIYKPKL